MIIYNHGENLQTRIVFVLSLLFLFSPDLGAETQACRPFRVYHGAQLPETPKIVRPRTLPPHWEKEIVQQITLLEQNGDFATLYWKTRPRFLHKKTRYEWLHCLAHYLKMDNDNDGVRDWTAIVDRQPSRVLAPHDTDMDGDGLDNVLDPNPLDKNFSVAHINAFPAHLRSKDAAVFHWQKKLRDDYGIIAARGTTEHSPFVLSEFHALLQKHFTPNFIRSLQSLRTLYASQAHSEDHKQAAYFHDMRAISLPGIEVYDGPLSGTRRRKLLSTLAHEIGHAFLLDKLKPDVLRSLCEENGWRGVFHADITDSFYSEAFFRRHPGWSTPTEAVKNNFFSDYAYKNAHEWFAEAFAESLVAENAPIDGNFSFAKWLKPHLQ